MKRISSAAIGRIGRAFTVFVALLFSTAACLGQQGDKLESVLRHMDKVSADFRTFEAEISTKKYTAVLEEFDPPENGRFYFKRSKNGTALIRWEIASPTEKIITLKDDEVVIFKPKIKYAEKIRLGDKKDKAEYLALGIGQSPSALKETFHILYKGIETVNGSGCSVLELKPKDPKAAAIFSTITLWIKDSTGTSAQMKLEEPHGDYSLVNFANEQLNKGISDSKFEQKLSKDVEILQVR